MRRTVWWAALAVLIVGNIILALIGANSDALQLSAKERRAGGSTQEYQAQLDTYLEEEDFLRFREFMEYHKIYTYQDPAWAVYVQIDDAAKCFSRVYTDLATAVMPGGEGREGILEDLAKDLAEFYEVSSAEKTAVAADPEKAEKACAGMRQQASQWLWVYGDCKPAEAEALENASAEEITRWVTSHIHEAGQEE